MNKEIPAELWLDIADLLCRADIVSLSSASKQLRSVLLHRLYSKLNICIPCEDEHCGLKAAPARPLPGTSGHCRTFQGTRLKRRRREWLRWRSHWQNILRELENESESGLRILRCVKWVIVTTDHICDGRKLSASELERVMAILPKLRPEAFIWRGALPLETVGIVQTLLQPGSRLEYFSFAFTAHSWVEARMRCELAGNTTQGLLERLQIRRTVVSSTNTGEGVPMLERYARDILQTCGLKHHLVIDGSVNLTALVENLGPFHTLQSLAFWEFVPGRILAETSSEAMATLFPRHNPTLRDLEFCLDMSQDAFDMDSWLGARANAWPSLRLFKIRSDGIKSPWTGLRSFLLGHPNLERLSLQCNNDDQLQNVLTWLPKLPRLRCLSLLRRNLTVEVVVAVISSVPNLVSLVLTLEHIRDAELVFKHLGDFSCLRTISMAGPAESFPYGADPHSLQLMVSDLARYCRDLLWVDVYVDSKQSSRHTLFSIKPDNEFACTIKMIEAPHSSLLKKAGLDWIYCPNEEKDLPFSF